jgi:hypothetical protein
VGVVVKWELWLEATTGVGARGGQNCGAGRWPDLWRETTAGDLERGGGQSSGARRPKREEAASGWPAEGVAKQHASGLAEFFFLKSIPHIFIVNSI